LTGYRGTGKTSVGEIVAQKLGLPLVDLDQRIEVDAHLTIREIFDRGGEAEFRRRETLALRSVASDTPSVVALGGGAILSEENRQCIRRTGTCVWLVADPATLASRIAGDQSTAERRPALTPLDPTAEIRHLLAQRAPLYASAADYRIDTTGKSTHEVADEVITLIGRR
jgi:shikimate kinase